MQPDSMATFSDVASGVRDFVPRKYKRTSHPLPILPVLGLEAKSLKLAFDIDSQYLSEVRRRTAVALAPSLFSPENLSRSAQLRTPQGYVVETDQNGTWKKVILARTSDAVGGGLLDVSIEAAQPGADLEEIFGRPNLFLVATKWPTTLLAKGALTIGGWSADLMRKLSTSPSANSPTIFIVKQGPGRIDNLINDTGSWTACNLFVGKGEEVEIQKRFRSLLNMKWGDAYIEQFKAAVTDPEWNGVLAIDAGVMISALPGPLRGLSAGLPRDLRMAFAGTAFAPIDKDPGSPWRNALFGTVYYDDKAAVVPGADGFALKVDALQAAFGNDQLQAFSSVLSLYVEKQFGQSVPANDVRKRLKGRFERRSGAGGADESVFTFELEKPAKIVFGAGLVRALDIRALRYEAVGVVGGNAASRFLIDGALEFGKAGSFDILGIDSLEFSQLSLNLVTKQVGDGHTFEFSGFDFPSVSFDFGRFNAERGARRSNSLLNDFPFKLRRFHLPMGRKLSDLGYVALGRSGKPDLALDFGLEFDADLGSLGALARKLERFSIKLFVGWSPAYPGDFAPGIKLDFGEGSGGFDLGLEGILRVRADQFAVLQSGSGPEKFLLIAAQNCSIDVLGTKAPSGGTVSIYLLGRLPKSGGVTGYFDKLGWLASYSSETLSDDPTSPASAADVDIEYVGLGQRLRIGTVSSALTAKEAVEALQKLGTIRDPDVESASNSFSRFISDQGITYDANSEWMIGFEGRFLNLITLHMILRDSDLYGMRAALTSGLEVDLLYTKIRDGLGRYSAEIELPEDWRTLDFGAVAVSLGAIRLDVYTDGGFLVDLGFPRDVDYTKSFKVQALPFIGAGGLYLGRLPRESSRLPTVILPGQSKAPWDYKPVYAAGLALRVGLGRELQRGPLRAGASLSVFGRLEGQLSFLNPADKNAPVPATYIWVRGEIGIVAEVFGEVDLSLIRIAISFRVFASTGIVLETDQPVYLFIRAGVSVSARVVIGRVSFFGGSFEISVHVEFQTDVEFGYMLGVAKNQQFYDRSATYLIRGSDAGNSRGDEQLPSALPRPVISLHAYFSSDAVRTDSGGFAVAFMLLAPADGARNSSASALMARRLLELALSDWRILTGHVKDEVTFEQAEAFSLFVSGASGSPASWVANMALKVFDKLVEDNFAITIESLSPPVSVAHLIPLPGCLKLNGRFADGSQDTDLGTLADLSQHNANSEGSAAQRVFRDWCDGLVRAGVSEFIRAFSKLLKTEAGSGSVDGRAPPAVKATRVLAEVSSGSGWDLAAQQAGAFLASSLRYVSTSSESLYVAAGYQHTPLNGQMPAAGKWTVALQASSGSWARPSNAVVTLDFADPTLREFASALPAIGHYEFEMARPSIKRPVWYAFGDVTDPIGQSLELVELPESIQRRTLESAMAGDSFSFVRRPRGGSVSIAEIDGAVNPPLISSVGVALLLEFAVEPVRTTPPGGTGKPVPVPGLYGFAGMSEAMRRRIDLALPEGSVSGLRLRLGWRQGGQLKLLSDAETASGRIFRNSFTVDRRPELAVSAVGPSEDIYSAELGDADAIELLRRAAIVNSGGTFLTFDASADPLKPILGTQEPIRLLLLIEWPAQAGSAVRIEPGANAVIVPQGTIGDVLHAKSETALDSAPATNALRGEVRVRLRRKIDQTDRSVSAELGRRFQTLSYTVLAGRQELKGKNAGRAADLMFPAVPSSWDGDIANYELVMRLSELLATEKKAEEKYAAIGQSFTIRSHWRDVYGNEWPEEGPAFDFTPLYVDPLIPISEWPFVQASACPHARGFQIAFVADLSTIKADKTEPEHRSIAAQRIRQVIDQLSDERTVLSTLCGLQDAPEPFTQKDLLVNFLKRVKDAIENGSVGKLAKTFDLSFVPRARRAFLPITLAVKISRPAYLVSADAGPSVGSCTCEIDFANQPLVGASRKRRSSKLELDLPEFAKAFAAAFNDSKREWLVGVGSVLPGEPRLWAVEANILPTGKAALEPTAMALAPLSRGRISVPAGPDNAAAADIDVDVQFRQFLADLEAMLAPAEAARILGQAGGVQRYAELADAKRRLAGLSRNQGDPETPLPGGWLPRRLMRAVYSGQGSRPEETEAALLELRDMMARDLTRFYEMGAYAASELRMPDRQFEGLKAYGVFSTGDSKGTGRATVQSRGLKIGGGDATLAFLASFGPRGDGTSPADSCISIKNAEYRFTHVERAVDEATPGRLRASNWLTLIPVGKPPSVSVGADFSLPVPLREAPPQPRMILQKASPAAVAGSDVAARIKAARSWTLTSEVSVPKFETDRDRLLVVVEYPTSTRSFGEMDDGVLLLSQSLVRYSAAKSGGDEAELFKAVFAVAEAFSPDERVASRTETAPRATNDYDPMIVSVVDGKTRIEFLDHLSETSPQRPPTRFRPGDVKASFVNDTWKIEIRDIDVIRCHSLRLSAAVERNAELCGKALDQAFIYRTDRSSFADFVKPILVRNDRFRSSASGKWRDRVTELLTAALSHKQASGQSVQLKAGLRTYEAQRIGDAMPIKGKVGLITLETDPKSLVAAELIEPSVRATIVKLADALSDHIELQFAKEGIPLSRPAGMRGSLILNLAVTPVGENGSEQPSLRLTELNVSL